MSGEADIRESILKNKGLRLVKQNKKFTITNKADLPKDTTGKKTTVMLYIEALHKTPIEKIIWEDSVIKIAERLEVPSRTISRWRTVFPRENDNEKS